MVKSTEINVKKVGPENFAHIRPTSQKLCYFEVTDTQTHRRTDAQTHRRTDALTHRCTDAQTHRCTDAQIRRCTDKMNHLTIIRYFFAYM